MLDRAIGEFERPFERARDLRRPEQRTPEQQGVDVNVGGIHGGPWHACEDGTRPDVQAIRVDRHHLVTHHGITRLALRAQGT